MTKKELFEALKDAPDECVVLVCKADPEPDFDNSGVMIERATWEEPCEQDSADRGVCYLAVKI